MANDRLIIDGTDARTAYGVIVVEDGLDDLLAWPASKAVDTASWAERDYIEADLSDLKLAGREASVNLALKGHMTDVEAFCSFLSGSIYRTWNMASVERAIRTRYIGAQSLEASATHQFFGVNLAVDTPLEGYTYTDPVSAINSVNEYSLDGRLLTDYGVRVLYGTLDSTAKPGSVKERLKRDISVLNGVLYDGAATNKKATYDITLRCGLIDTTFSGLWRNYDALLYDLTRKNENVTYDTDKCKRTVHSFRLNHDFECYYKSQSVREFWPDGSRIWLLFDVTLGVVGDMYVPNYLATEAGEWVKTENGLKIRI